MASESKIHPVKRMTELIHAPESVSLLFVVDQSAVYGSQYFYPSAVPPLPLSSPPHFSLDKALHTAVLEFCLKEGVGFFL